jgi:arylsulfatase A-like enzyme
MKLPVLLFLAAAGLASADPVPAHRVLHVVFDGMRPDFISPENTPNLARLAARGVFFAHHHPVYVSATEVNGTAMATGSYPENSFIIANTDYRPAIDAQKSIGTEIPENIRKGDAVMGGHYLGRPTVAEILHAHGLPTAIAGSKNVALLHDRAERAPGPGVSPILFMGATQPAGLINELTAKLGAFPPVNTRDDKVARDAWTTQALLGTFWQDGVPPYSLLWLAEPDSSQHMTGPGSDQSLEAIRSSDANLGLVLAELERRGLLDTTDVFVVSDHAFSTVTRRVDVAVELSKAGFAAKRAAPGGLTKGDVLAVGNGGSTLMFIGGHDEEVIRRLAAYLQQQDWVGVVFSRLPIEGTFPLTEAHIASPEAPDIVISLRWHHGKSATGAPGLLTSDVSSVAIKMGTHASLSPYEMHNTLVAAGPDIRRGVTNTLPSANLDLAPTFLWLLGVKDEVRQMDGRVLSEALTVEAPPLKSYELKRLNARRETAAGTWTQYLQISEVNGVRYLDEGNGDYEPKAAASAK